MDNEETKSQIDLEWEQRTLCIDESCIGVIGPDGRCKECGLAYDGQQLEELPKEQIAAQIEDTEVDIENEEDEEASEDDAARKQADLEWEQRTLCRDESCIGVIGPDGRCKVCNLPYEEG